MPIPVIPVNPSLIRLAKYLKPCRGLIAASVFFMVTAGASSSLIAGLLGKLTDAGFYEHDPLIIFAAPIGLVLISFMHGASMYMSSTLLVKASQRVIRTLRSEMYRRFIHWPADEYQRQPTGVIASKFVFEANAALTSAAKSSITVVRDSVQVVALTVVLFWHNLSLAFVSLVIVPLLAVLLRHIRKTVKRVMAGCQSSLGGALVLVKEAYDGHEIIKLSDTAEAEAARFRKINEEVRAMSLGMTKVTAMSTPVTQLITMTAVAVVLAVAMYETQQGLITAGDFVTFLAALLLLMPPLRNLAGVSTGFLMMGMAAESIFDMLDKPLEENAGTVELGRAAGRIRFENVSLTYEGSDRPAVAKVTLTPEPGTVTALVGLSGSGKSTLVSLLPRFRNPTEGRILLDGVDLRDITLESLRRQIALVSQDPFLFDDTLRANIVYGMPDATPDEVDAALEAAALTDFVATLPQGLDTPVGEGGSFLSGGQKQRVAIARAFLKNAPILILDEATSALDAESEAKVREALERLMAGRTVFIVAHRLSGIPRRARIVALADGRIAEEGTADELLRRNGTYAHLCRLQAESPAFLSGGAA